MKFCKLCQTEKELECFSKSVRNPDGLCYHCRLCRAANRKEVSGNKDKERGKTYRQTPAGRFAEYKKGAVQRGYQFDLTKKQFMRFWQMPCEYCGDDIETIGLDRIDNNIGYAIDNIRSCCSSCNVSKNNKTEKEFFEMVAKIYLRHCAGECARGS